MLTTQCPTCGSAVKVKRLILNEVHADGEIKRLLAALEKIERACGEPIVVNFGMIGRVAREALRGE
jgi:hypothetical protein